MNMAWSSQNTILMGTPENIFQLSKKIQAMQPWELVWHLEKENLDVSGNMAELRERLVSHHSHQVQKMQPSNLSASCEINKYFEDFNNSLKRGFKDEYLTTEEPLNLEMTKRGDYTTEKQPIQKETHAIVLSMMSCNEILNELFSPKHSSYAWPFYMPAELSDLYNNNFIEKPMDLGTIKRKMHENLYNTPSEFAADVRLIFENCRKYYYYSLDYKYVGMAKQLENVFEKRYAKMFEQSSKEILTDSKAVLLDKNSEKISNDQQECMDLMQQSVEQLLQKVQILEEEINKNSRIIGTLQAGTNEKLNENEHRKQDEDKLNYRLKCAKLMKLWNWNSEFICSINSAMSFLENLKEFRKFSKINDCVLLEMLPCVLPKHIKEWYRKEHFDSWESFEEKFHQKFTNVNFNLLFQSMFNENPYSVV